MQKRITKLILAASTGDFDLVEKLTKPFFFIKGVDVNTTSCPGGDTPLYSATKEGHLKIVELLIARGADINEVDCYGSSLLYFALFFQFKEIAVLLIDKGVDVNVGEPIMEAVRNDYKDIVKLLVEKGADVNVRTAQETTPLIQASRWGHKEIVEFLVIEGADVNARNIDGETPLNLASNKDYKEIAEFLITKGAQEEKLPIGMPLIKIIQLLGPPTAGMEGGDVMASLKNTGADISGALSLSGAMHGKQFMEWERPEGKYQLVIENGKLARIFSAP